MGFCLSFQGGCCLGGLYKYTHLAAHIHPKLPVKVGKLTEKPLHICSSLM